MTSKRAGRLRRLGDGRRWSRISCQGVRCQAEHNSFSAGIGQAIAQRYALEGASVAVAEVDPEWGTATEEVINSRGGEAVFLPTDVSDEARVKELLQARSWYAWQDSNLRPVAPEFKKR